MSRSQPKAPRSTGNKTMNSTRNTLVLAGLALALVSTADAQIGRFRLVNLLPAGAQSGTATGLNDKGEVVGRYFNASGVSVPFIYRNGTTQDLIQPSNFTNVIPTDLNDLGHAVGYGSRPLAGGGTTSTALAWSLQSNGNAVAVQVYPFANFVNGKSWFNAVNNIGMAVGAANGQDPQGTSTTLMQPMGYFIPNNVKSAYPNLATQAGLSSEVLGNNNNGDRVGWALNTQGKTLGAKWNGNSISILTAPAEATGAVYARAINNVGRVVGEYFVSASQSKAFFKNNFDAMIAIPRLPGAGGDDSNSAVSINFAGEVVGTCEIGNGNHHAFIWDGSTIATLASKVNGLRVGNTITGVSEINNRSEIAATMRSASVDYPVLLKPVQPISCQIDLQDYIGAYSGRIIEWEAQGANQEVLDSGLALMDSQGNCQIDTTAQGEFDLVIKTSHWLSRRLPMNLSTFDSSTVSASLVNGDVDGDNSVSIFDYIELSGSFDKATGESGFDAEADLDGDGAVTIFDYIILSNNFDQSGE